MYARESWDFRRGGVRVSGFRVVLLLDFSKTNTDWFCTRTMTKQGRFLTGNCYVESTVVPGMFASFECHQPSRNDQIDQFCNQFLLAERRFRLADKNDLRLKVTFSVQRSDFERFETVLHQRSKIDYVCVFEGWG